MGPPGTKVYIGNLPDECDEDKLRTMFEGVGPLAEIDIIKNYGFVHFNKESDAKKSVEKLNDVEFCGKPLKVEQSRSSVRHKPGMGGMTECYSCGRPGHWSKDCRSRGRGRGGGGRGRGFDRDPYADPYGEGDPYYGRRFPPPPHPPHPAGDRYSPYGDPYERRRMVMARDQYYMERERDYYDQVAARDAYYDYYARRRAYAGADDRIPGAAPGGYARPPADYPPSRSRVPGPY